LVLAGRSGVGARVTWLIGRKISLVLFELWLIQGAHHPITRTQIELWQRSRDRLQDPPIAPHAARTNAVGSANAGPRRAEFAMRLIPRMGSVDCTFSQFY
jgi:hypothetical protein